MHKKTKYVQAIIANINFDSTLDEVYHNRENWTPAEIVINNSQYYMEGLKKLGKTEFECYWSVRPWMKEGDIVFFMCAKTSFDRASRLQNKFLREIDTLKCKYTQQEIEEMKEYLHYGVKICKEYAGTIFAIGVLSGNPYYKAPDNEDQHWKTRTYANIQNIYFMKNNPISYKEIEGFITLAVQTSITTVYGEEFHRLLGMVKESVELPALYDNLVAAPKELSEHEKQDWLSLAKKYGFRFTQEAEFRSLFVNSFLGTLSTRLGIYRECECIKKGTVHPSYADNMIYLGDKLLPVEVKLNIHTERDLKGQIRKYCRLTELYLDSAGAHINKAKEAYRDNVLVIDTEGLYMYDCKEDSITEICKLQDLKSLKGIPRLRRKIAKMLQ